MLFSCPGGCPLMTSGLRRKHHVQQDRTPGQAVLRKDVPDWMGAAKELSDEVCQIAARAGFVIR